MATKRKVSASDDARKGQARYVDQKGQWINTTPASVKRRQNKEWKKLESMMKVGAKKRTKKG